MFEISYIFAVNIRRVCHPSLSRLTTTITSASVPRQGAHFFCAVEDTLLKDQLKLLVQLQTVDAQLQELEEAKGDLPREVKRLGKEQTTLQSAITKLDSQTTAAKTERREQEGMIATTSDTLKKHQDQLYDVTSNREYDAITQEIEIEREQISNGETRVLELIELEETTDTTLTEKKELLVAVEQALSSKGTELSRLLKENEKRERKLTHERDKISVRVPKTLMRHYTRVATATDGRAVVPLERGACSGCSYGVPPQLQSEVRRMDQLIICESCGRILVVSLNGQQ